MGIETAILAGTIGGAVIGGVASNRAAKTQAQAVREGAAAQADATQKSIEAQERMFNRQIELQEPFRRAGVNALPELVRASRYTPFGMEQFQADPGYGFRLKEGLRALENSAAARGGLLSGNTMRGVTQFGQELGSQEFTNAFNRYQLERQARLNPLQALAGVGQTAANTMGAAAGQYGQGMAQTYGQMGQNMAQNAATMGNIRASGYTGIANALTGALGQGLNYYQNQQMLNRFFPQQQTLGGAAAPPGLMI
jgi:hypothetical protein